MTLDVEKERASSPLQLRPTERGTEDRGDSVCDQEFKLKGNAFLRSEKTVTFRLQFGEFVLSRISFSAVLLYFELGAQPKLGSLALENLSYGPYDLVSFPNMDAALRSGLVRWSSGCLWYAPVVRPVYCVNLNGSFEDYLRQFSKGSRKNLRRDRERFREASVNGRYFREYRRPAEMKDFLCTARSISVKTYQNRLLGLDLPDTDEFLDNLTRHAENDLVRGYILYYGDLPVAFSYCLGRGSRLGGQMTGYDPAFADYSPGTILHYCLLESLLNEHRFELFDFGIGDAFYKSFFSTHSFNCANIFCFRLSAKSLAFVICHVGLAALSRTAVRLTKALSVKDRIKKWARANVGAHK